MVEDEECFVLFDQAQARQDKDAIIDCLRQASSQRRRSLKRSCLGRSDKKQHGRPFTRWEVARGWRLGRRVTYGFSLSNPGRGEDRSGVPSGGGTSLPGHLCSSCPLRMLHRGWLAASHHWSVCRKARPGEQGRARLTFGPHFTSAGPSSPVESGLPYIVLLIQEGRHRHSPGAHQHTLPPVNHSTRPVYSFTSPLSTEPFGLKRLSKMLRARRTTAAILRAWRIHADKLGGLPRPA